VAFFGGIVLGIGYIGAGLFGGTENSIIGFPSVCHFYLHCPAVKKQLHEAWKDVV